MNFSFACFVFHKMCIYYFYSLCLYVFVTHTFVLSPFLLYLQKVKKFTLKEQNEEKVDSKSKKND